MASQNPYLEYANGGLSQILGWLVTALFVTALLGLGYAVLVTLF
jgi:hypothetical protein